MVPFSVTIAFSCGRAKTTRIVLKTEIFFSVYRQKWICVDRALGLVYVEVGGGDGDPR